MGVREAAFGPTSQLDTTRRPRPRALSLSGSRADDLAVAQLRAAAADFGGVGSAVALNRAVANDARGVTALVPVLHDAEVRLDRRAREVAHPDRFSIDVPVPVASAPRL